MNDYNFMSLKKISTENLKKLYESAIADKDLYIKRLKEINKEFKENTTHFKKHIKQSDMIIENIAKVMLDRCKDD